MGSGIIASVICPHTPRMAVAASAPDFVQPLIAGIKALGTWIRDLRPDCVVVHSTHWVCTFNWYATACSVHEGVCIAEEAPDLFPGQAYRYRGDPTLALTLCEHATADRIPFNPNTSEHYRWDYGSYVPLKYIDPDASLPIVTIPTVILASLDECLSVGRLVDSSARATGKRVVFVASTALSHALVRGPEQWPSAERQALDRKFIALIERGDVAAAIQWLPEYARESVSEMGGRVLASFLGALAAISRPSSVRRFGPYAQSSGSGNQTIACSPALAAA